MKKLIKEKYSTNGYFDFVKLTNQNFIELIELLKENGIKKIKIIDEKYEYNISDVSKIKNLNKVKIEGKSSIGNIIISFSDNKIYIDKYSLGAEGLIGKIKEKLKKFERRFINIFIEHGSFIGLFFLLLSEYLFFANKINIYILFIISLLCFLFLVGPIYSIIKIKNKLIIKENFWKKNKDQILVGIITTTFGIIIGFIIKSFF